MARILMVGSDRKIMTMTSRILKRNGYDVHVAIGMKEGYENMNAIAPEVAIVNQELSDGEGIGFCENVKQQNDRTKILILSLDGQDEIPALQAGADDWIRKPYSMDVMLARVAKLISQLK